MGKNNFGKNVVMPEAGKHVFNSFRIRILTGKKQRPKPRACRKQEISIFQSFSN